MANNTPKHILLLPDGNGRWARKNKLSEIQGYKAGYENLLAFANWCKVRGIKTLTVFGFSTENWDRGSVGINLLLKMLQTLLLANIDRYLKSPELKKLGIRVKVIGQRERLPKTLQKAIEKVEEITKNNHEMFLNLGISYGGKWDIIEAVKKIIEEGIDPEKIDEKLFEKYLSTSGLPNPDFVIRTGGDARLSNTFLWQLAYAELYFTPKFWPEFSEQNFDIALAEYSKRLRPAGK